MTMPDDSRDEPGRGVPEGEAGLPADVDAAWQAIVEHYGERPALGPDETGPDEQPSSPRGDASPPTYSVLDRSFLESQERARRDAAQASEAAAASWADEGHYVPPEPPPVPQTTPARRLAWIGLFGAPLAMLVAVIAHLVYPTWLSMGLVAAFVGGFVFLVATMPTDRHDGWDGDDGAVV